MATDADIINLTLRKVYVLEGDEVAAAEDYSAMETVYVARMEYLREAELVWWEQGSVPDGVKDPLAEYLTFYCPVLPREERERYRGDSMMGLREIRGLAQMLSDDTPIRVDYF